MVIRFMQDIQIINFFARIVKVKKKSVGFLFEITIVQKINESWLNEHNIGSNKYLLMAGWENGD